MRLRVQSGSPVTVIIVDGENNKEAADTGRRQGVADYLRAHPDFFLSHLDLLAKLHIPNPNGEAGTISLIEHQVRVLRERHANEQRQLLNLVDTARDNERLAERLHRVAVEALGMDDLDNTLDSLASLIRELFRVEWVSFRIRSSGGQRAELVDPRDPEFADVCLNVVNGRSVCNNRLHPSQLAFLFGTDVKVASLILIPLGRGRPLGVLALGSSDARRFGADQGTFYMDRLGELLAAVIGRLLD